MKPDERAKFEAETDGYMAGLRAILQAVADHKKTVDQALEDMTNLKMAMQAAALLADNGDPCGLRKTPHGAAQRG